MVCYRCMRVTRTRICETCGFDPDRYEQPPFALAPGSVLRGRYHLGAVLGHGGFGITYVGYDAQGKRRVAVKEFFPAAAVTRDIRTGPQVRVEPSFSAEFEKGVREFYNEAVVMKELAGTPTIVAVYDFFRENGTAYIVMEFVEGSGADKLIRARGALPFALTMTIYYPILKGLRVMHARSILHRDISPSNIILDGRMNARLIDFGASRVYFEELSSDLTVILKHGYAPLEQYMRRGRHGPPEDIYAICASMYATLTGHVPPPAPERIRFDTLTPISAYPTDVPPAVEAVIMKGLALHATDRYQTVSELLTDLDRALVQGGGTDGGGRGKKKKKDGASRSGADKTNPAREGSRIPWLLIALLAAAVVLTVVLLLILFL